MDAKELSSQLKKPVGETGREIAKILNDSNSGLYDLTFETVSMQTKSENNILEIGFGNGKHFPFYFSEGKKLNVFGVDFSSDMCDEARILNRDLISQNKLHIHCADTTSLPFPDNHIDLAIAVNVIYFLDPPGPHLKEIQRVLKPGGHLLIGYRPRHAVEHLEFTKQNFILYEADELHALLKNNGFEIVKEETRRYQKKAADNTDVHITDACILVRSIFQ